MGIEKNEMEMPNKRNARNGSWFLALIFTAIMGVVITGFAHQIGPERPAFAFWLNGLLMVWAVGFYRSKPLQWRNGYFRIRPWETPVYRALGVPGFQRFLRRVNWFNREIQLKTGRRGLSYLDHAIRQAEQGHATIFVIIGGFTVFAIVHYGWGTAWWYVLFNVLFNGYPVMVQRYNRARMQRVLNRR